MSAALFDQDEPAASPVSLVKAEVPDETRDCPECGETITGKARGAGSLAWKMGQHRRNKHGVKGAGRKGRPRAGEPTDADRAARPVISAVRDVAAGVTGKGTPNADQLGNGLGRGLGLLTMSVATFAVETDPAIPRTPEGDQQRDGLVDYLSLSPEAAAAIMRPVGRALAPTKLNQRYGRKVVDNVDLIGSAAELIQVGYHWREYFKMRAAFAAQIAAGTPAGTQPPGVPAMAPAPTATPGETVIHPSGLVQTPPPASGVVLDAAMIAEMQQQRSAN